MSRLRYTDDPFTMGNLDDLMIARENDDMEYLKEWSRKAVPAYEEHRNIQMKTFRKLIDIKKEATKSVGVIHQMLKDNYDTLHRRRQRENHDRTS